MGGKKTKKSFSKSNRIRKKYIRKSFKKGGSRKNYIRKQKGGNEASQTQINAVGSQINGLKQVLDELSGGIIRSSNNVLKIFKDMFYSINPKLNLEDFKTNPDKYYISFFTSIHEILSSPSKSVLDYFRDPLAINILLSAFLRGTFKYFVPASSDDEVKNIEQIKSVIEIHGKKGPINTESVSLEYVDDESEFGGGGQSQGNFTSAFEHADEDDF